MKIHIDKNLVELTPENSEETVKLEALWKVIVDCARFSRKLVPVGEYVPQKNNMARFAIEGEAPENVGTYPEVYADKECTCYCQTCNKYVNLKKGDQIPPCCGRLMEVLD
jgi:hypothetical protein